MTVLIGSLSCDIAKTNLEETEPLGPVTVKYLKYDGLGMETSLNVYDSTSTVVLTSTYPEFDKRLSGAEFSLIMEEFSDIKNIDYEFENQCFDTPIYKIIYLERDYEKEIDAEACALYSEKDNDSNANRIFSMVTTLDSLYDNIYESEAPWRDLKASFSLNKEVYTKEEPIISTYTITNDTNEDRSLWFKTQDQVYFRVNTSFFYPERWPSEVDNPSKIIIAPGEEIELNFEWDQFNTEEIKVPSGQYNITLNLLAGDFTQQSFVIEIKE